MKCGFCGGLLRFLGQLGRLSHFRCQGCGMQSSREISDEELEALEEELEAENL